MTKQLTLLIFNLLSASIAIAGSGIFQSYIILDENGSGDSFYAGSINPEGSTSFHSNTYTPLNSLILKGGELKTFKNSGSNVTGAEMNYRIYLDGSTPPAFQTIALPFNSNLGSGGDQKWQSTSANIDLKLAINNLGSGPGNYILEVFWRATSSDGDHFDSNSSDNHKATIVATLSFLPVKFINFKATNSQNHNILSWQTATESNNSHFDIQRSIDSKTWLNIGRTEGNGTSTQIQSYSFADKAPLFHKNYYRLKQIDYDGSYSYSPIVSLNYKNWRINIFPNPVNDYFDIQFADFKEGDQYSILISNSLGQVVHKTTTLPYTKVNITNLPTGIYILNILDNNGEILFTEQLSKL